MSEKLKNLFGEEVEYPNIDKEKGRKRFKTMQQMHGLRDGETCRTCKHCRGYSQSKTWYKCKLWYQSSSSATDIRLKNKACAKWEAEDET